MQTRLLIRARGLATFSDALCQLSTAGSLAAIRRRLVIVPTRAAAELLRQTIEGRLDRAGPTAASVLPDFVTRDEWYRRMHASAVRDRPLLTRSEREVLLERAAMEVHQRRGIPLPFQLRPGLIATVLDFHDELRRRQRTTRRFVRAIFDELRTERGTDRGSESLIDQTRFLGFTFLAYERGVQASGGLDEHALRRVLLAGPARLDFDDLIIAVADHPADPSGLWPSDFDLAGRLSALSSIRVVMTDEAHDAGFRDRLERELPGVDEQRWPEIPTSPRVVVPSEAPADRLVWMSRDREEEIRGVARVIRERAVATGGRLARSAAIVFHRPLPYLYLAQQVLTDAGIPYQAFDALPLAAEPYAALLDLALALARTGGTREGAIDLLRSRLLTVEVDGVRVSRRDASALDALLGERRASGDASTYVAEVQSCAPHSARSFDLTRAARAALGLAQLANQLAAFRSAGAASEQVQALDRFLRTYERQPRTRDESAERHRRARAAVLTVLGDLSSAFARHDNRARPPDDLAAIIHHAIEGRTFTPRRGVGGVHLVDRSAARFGSFVDAFLVGLVETDWSDRPRRSVLYSSGLLKNLGWPQDTDQALAQQAAFADTLSLARERVRLSAFQLDGDSIVAVTPLVELARRLPTAAEDPPDAGPLFPDELLTRDAVPIGLQTELMGWLALRRRRPAIGDRAYSGFVDVQPPAVYRVSRVDQYVTCPFKYFAAHVLRLPEDRQVKSGLTPLERGTLLHSLFERFYGAWQEAGHGAIEMHTLEDAVRMFARITGDALADLPEPDRVLEQTRLLGSIVNRGVAERVFELEIGSRAVVRRRLVELDLIGDFSFPIRHGLDTRTIAIRGKADRIDVLHDGSLRVVDYKLGRMPDLDTSVQVGVYAFCAEQRLSAEDGAPHPVAAASYLAFGDDRRLEGRIGGTSEPAGIAVHSRASNFAGIVERIESGSFPPQPRTTAECQWCGYAGVCRKEYRTAEENDATTDAV